MKWSLIRAASRAWSKTRTSSIWNLSLESEAGYRRERFAAQMGFGVEQVNRVLMQPHWRKDHDLEPI